MKSVVSSTRMIVVCLVALISVSAARADFVYSDFSSTAGLNLLGSAAQYGTHLRVTPATTYQNGAVWKQGLQSVGQGFSTTFEFQATGIGGAHDAGGNYGFDYVSFTLQNTGDSIEDITAYPVATNPRVRIFLDGYNDAGSTDLSTSTVYVVHDGQALVQANLEAWGIMWRDQAIHQISISYVPQALKVVVDGFDVVNLTGIDMAGWGLNNAYIGFQGRTGAAYANEDILSWSFQSVPEPASLLVLALGGLLLRRRL